MACYAARTPEQITNHSPFELLNPVELRDLSTNRILDIGVIREPTERELQQPRHPDCIMVDWIKRGRLWTVNKYVWHR